MAKNIFMASGNERIDLAIKNARKTLKFFLRETSWESRRIVPGLDLAVVKLSFKTDKKPWFGLGQVPEVEHVWAMHPQFDGKLIVGILINKAKWCKGRKAGRPAGGPIDLLADWMYVMDGKVYGGFTVDAMRAEMEPAERARHDAAWGLDFGEVGTVLLSPKFKKADDGELTFDFEQAYTFEDRASLAMASHPMDLNMREALVDALKQNPQMVNEADELGMSMLHDASLAGNDQTVQTLLAFGANKSATNHNLQTPLDLAKLMGWPKVIALLES